MNEQVQTWVQTAGAVFLEEAALCWFCDETPFTEQNGSVGVFMPNHFFCAELGIPATEHYFIYPACKDCTTMLRKDGQPDPMLTILETRIKKEIALGRYFQCTKRPDAVRPVGSLH